jgi:hypothetical protein
MQIYIVFLYPACNGYIFFGLLTYFLISAAGLRLGTAFFCLDFWRVCQRVLSIGHEVGFWRFFYWKNVFSFAL